MKRIWSYLFGFALLVLPVGPAVAQADAPAFCLIGDHPGIPESDAQTASLLVCDALRKQGISVTDPVYEAPATANAYRVIFRRIDEQVLFRLSHENPIGTIIIERKILLPSIEAMASAAPRLVHALVHNKPIDIFDITRSDLAKIAEVDAKRDAINDVNKFGWFLAGFSVASSPLLFREWANEEPSTLKTSLWVTVNLLYLHFAHLRASSPPPERLLGKPPEYVSSYIDTYRKKYMKWRARSAGCGYIVGCGLVFYFALEEWDFGGIPSQSDF